MLTTEQITRIGNLIQLPWVEDVHLSKSVVNNLHIDIRVSKKDPGFVQQVENILGFEITDYAPYPWYLGSRENVICNLIYPVREEG